MAQLALSFLGTFAVQLDGQKLSRFRSSNVQGLLVYLALQANHAFARDSLATLFWPEQSDSTARKNLRQALYQLRKVLDDSDKNEQSFLLVSRRSIQFNPQSNFVLDVAQFLTALDEGDLATAVSHYTADLLPGFTCDSLEFEEWLRSERERLRGLALAAMSKLGARYLRNGHVEDAQTIARQQIKHEPWSESANQQLIEALALSGNRTAALAQFEQFQEILADELGVSPSNETFDLIARIENDELQPIDPNLIAGRFTLEDEIGRGAMGIVYRGQDAHTGKRVAIKLVDEQRLTTNPSLLARLRREGEALEQLNHPNIVHLLAMDEKDGRHHLVMEHIAGGDLSLLLNNQPQLPIKRALAIALDLADALTRAHRLGILHRDLKPANILLDENGLPKLTDFGIARLGQDSNLTEEGAVLGTFSYLSPEACLGELLDERADIWAFGVLLYEMLAGERPFTFSTSAHAASPAAVITHILHDPLPDIRKVRPDIPDALEDLLYRMLAKNRADRIPSARLVGAELEAILQDAPLPATSKTAKSQPKPKQPLRDVFATPTPERFMQARHNLPNQSTPFVGRDAEIAELTRLLADAAIQLVTILGPGGMGKTRLSLEAAERFVDGTSATRIAFPDGVYFVELATANSVEQMITAVATAFGFAIERELEPIQQIINFMANKQLLLLLDNFEQLLTSTVNGTDVITAILQAVPHIKIIVTSRQKLNLRSEVVFALEGLAFPDFQTAADALSYSAVQLFEQSAQRIRYDFTLEETTVQHIARICRLTEGMPLGIVLAAAWIDMLSLAEIADEMQRDIDFLTTEMGDLPPRQRSMRAVFDYSWALLTEPEQQILAKLSVFRGGFTRDAAQVVTGAGLRQLLGLVNKSLIQRDVVNGRFSLHELLRQLAAEKLNISGEADAVKTVHSHYYLQLLVEKETALYDTQQKATVQALMAADQNIRAAWLWAAQTGDVKQLLPAIESFLLYSYFWGGEFELQELYIQTLSLLPSGDPTLQDTAHEIAFLRASILNRLQELGFPTDEKGQPIDIDRLYALFQARGAQLEEAITCQHLGYRAVEQQKFDQVLYYFQRQTSLYEAVQTMNRLAGSLNVTGMLAWVAGQTELSRMLNQRALAVARQTNNRLQEAAAYFASGVYALGEKVDYDYAKQQFSNGLTLGLEMLSDGFGSQAALFSLAAQSFASLLQGDIVSAQEFAQKMQELVVVRNHPREQASTDMILRLIEATMGRYTAIELKALNQLSSGHPIFADYCLTLNAWGLGNSQLVITSLIRRWSMPVTMRWLSHILRDIPPIAFILAERGDFSRAVALLAMGWAHPACPHGWWKVMVLLQELEARLQAVLSPEEYAAAQARGQEMDVRATAVSLLEELKAMVNNG